MRWPDGLLAWRDRMLADPVFQRRAASIPFVRRIANRHAKALFDVCAGFTYSQVLAACVRLDIFEMLSAGPLSVADIAARCSLPETAAGRLLEAAEALGLTGRRSAGRYGLGMLGAALAGNPAIADMVSHHSLLYGDLADPVALLRGDGSDRRIADFWPYAESAKATALTDADVGPYSELMSASQGMIVDDILDAYPFGRHLRMLDVGGGDGTFASALAQRCAAIEARVVDLPAVVERAKERIVAAGLAGRLAAAACNFRVDPLPQGADLVTLIRVLHDHDDDTALPLLRRVCAALPIGGRIVIAEPMAGSRGAESVGAYFALYFLAMGSGCLRTRERLSDMLKSVGFSTVRAVSTRRPVLVSMLVAEKSAPSVKLN